jgi:hypothetical protein
MPFLVDHHGPFFPSFFHLSCFPFYLTSSLPFFVCDKIVVFDKQVYKFRVKFDFYAHVSLCDKKMLLYRRRRRAARQVLTRGPNRSGQKSSPSRHSTCTNAEWYERQSACLNAPGGKLINRSRVWNHSEADITQQYEIPVKS